MTSINQLRKPMLALDLPSGLNANTGIVEQNAILATHTVSFLANKIGLASGEGPEYAGNIYVETLGIDVQLFSVYEPVTDVSADQVDIKARYVRRRRDIQGQVLVIGGNEGMLNSIMWAAKSATVAGADFVRVITLAKHAPFLNMKCPELMAYTDQNVEDLASRSSVVLIGPGLRRDGWTRSLWQQVVFSQKPLVVDAGALRLLATNPLHADNWILVANHSEAAELLGVTISEVETDRVAAVTTLQETYGGVIVLKGFNILVFDGQELRMGDDIQMVTGMSEVLSGMIAGFVARGGYSLTEAAVHGVTQFVEQSAEILDQVQHILRPNRTYTRRAA
jgi:NAD(P)H-hydrate epimerase